MKKILLSKYFWLILIGIFIISRLATWFYPYDSDHWIFYYVGKFLAQGKDIYLEAWDHKPPIGFSINALMSSLFGANIIVHRIFLTVVTIIEIFIFYKFTKVIIKSENKTYLIRLSLVFYVLFRNLSQFTSSANNTENFAMLFMIMMYYLYYLNKSKVINLILVGLCMSLLILLKPTFVVLILPIIIDLLIANKKQLGQFLKQLILIAIPILIHIGLWAWYFYSRNTLNDFWIATVSFNSKYAQAAWAGHVSGRSVFIVMIAPFLTIYLITLIPYFKKTIINFKNTDNRFLLITAFVTLLVALMNGSFYSYYFLLSVMPLSILIANDVFIDFINSKNTLKYILIFCVLVNVVISYKQFVNSITGNVKLENQENIEIANYIKSNTNENDTIIAYTYGATFYTLTQRDSGSRYISASHLLLDEREQFGFGLTDNFISDIKKNNPKYCIFPKDPESLYLQNQKASEYLLDNFKLEKEFNNYYLLKNINN